MSKTLYSMFPWHLKGKYHVAPKSVLTSYSLTGLILHGCVLVFVLSLHEDVYWGALRELGVLDPSSNIAAPFISPKLFSHL